jgi:hypothetical protein
MLSQARHKELLSGQNSAAKSVYEATPMAEAWTVPEIVTELRRMGRCSDFKHVAGCLNTLTRAGLIKESKPGAFIRESIKKDTNVVKAPTKTTPAAPCTNPPAPAAKPASSPLEKMGALAAQANILAEQLKNLSSEIETVALEVEEHISTTSGGLEKLKQFQALLKSLDQ